MNQGDLLSGTLHKALHQIAWVVAWILHGQAGFLAACEHILPMVVVVIIMVVAVTARGLSLKILKCSHAALLFALRWL